MFRINVKLILVFAVVAFNQIFNGSACHADAICPHTYLFAQNGFHFYSAVRCEPVPCIEIPVSVILAYNKRVMQLGCEQSDPNDPNTDCQCRTSLVPTNVYDVQEDLAGHYDPKAQVSIRNDHFVGTQIGNRKVYFRTLTFVTKNSAGVTQEQSIAVPISANAMNAIVQKGLSGMQVVVYKSFFDGANVVLEGKAFRALLTNHSLAILNQKSAYSRSTSSNP